jgi:hypothetical protein
MAPLTCRLTPRMSVNQRRAVKVKRLAPLRHADGHRERLLIGVAGSDRRTVKVTRMTRCGRTQKLDFQRIEPI